MKTRVVHVNKDKFDVYIGRQSGRFYGSMWANPFPITPQCTRDQSIEQYKTWIVNLLKNDPEIKEMLVRQLKGKTLGCWCKPERCHGDFLAHIADNSHLI